MTDERANQYVYVYIDPRNYEEFYYGMGKDRRKNAHLFDDKDSEKTRRIKAIQNAGQKPIIKVIARNLTTDQALLVEKTLIWKLGRNLTNVSGGQFASNFRPHDTFHVDLYGFDYKNGIYNVNIGEGTHRCWEDCREFGFLSAGQGKIYSDPLRSLEVGDIVAAYLRGRGYVGIGRIKERAVAVADFQIDGKLLREQEHRLRVPGMFINCDNENSEYLVKVEWIKFVDSQKAKPAKRKEGIYSSQLVKSTLQGQPKTVAYLEKEFNVKFSELLSVENF